MGDLGMMEGMRWNGFLSANILCECWYEGMVIWMRERQMRWSESFKVQMGLGLLYGSLKLDSR